MEREDEIRLIAYSIWEEEGRPEGRDREHWVRAEAIWGEQNKVTAAISAKTESQQPVEPEAQSMVTTRGSEPEGHMLSQKSAVLPRLESPLNWRNDSDLRQVDVVVCTTAGTFVGHAYRTIKLRLLDALNKGFAACGAHIALDYIPMTEVEMYYPKGGMRAFASVSVRKAAVAFVAERSGGQPDARSRMVERVIVTKKPVDAKLCMLQYVLTGRLYSLPWAELLSSLEQEDAFIPFTNVRVLPPLITGEMQFDFVAVNHSHVLCVGDSV